MNSDIIFIGLTSSLYISSTYQFYFLRHLRPMVANGNTSLDEREQATDLQSIKHALEIVRQHGHLTPVHTSRFLDHVAGRELHFKCEQFQRGGAFKFRGAINSVFGLSEDEAFKGVVTHSSGNHAGALALAAKIRGIPAYIVVPRDAPQCKLDAVKTYEGRISLCEPTIDAREETCAQIQNETGAHFIHPYNNPNVIAGQGTIGLELLEQVPDLDAIIVPVSGGGLISGISIAAKSINPNIEIFAAEPTGRNNAADCAASKRRGEIVSMNKPQTIADGLQARLGNLTWPQVKNLVSDVITVSDEEIVSAMKLLYERMKLVVEPSGATALAGALSKQFLSPVKFRDLRKVGIVISGGNVDLGAKGFWQLWNV